MNTITLNGVRSDTIQGLLIQSLPPISKPPIRVNVEEIDGRNGDIITDLGYQAYDKTFTIGLRGSFDINDVISFFNSEGTVVFSNEPDKYYRYKIYQQIDFERLIRFRVATVTMHVQPFKYPLNETPISVSSLIWEGTDYDQTPYIFRAVSDSSVEAGNREIIEQITGGTVAFNQSLEEGLRSSGNTTKVAYNRCNATFDSTTHEYTLTSLQNQGTSGFYYGANQGAVINPNHVYIISFEAKAPKTFNVKIGLNPGYATKTGFSQNVYHSIGAVVKIDSSTKEFLFNFNADNAWDGSETVYARNLMVIDLTQMFGTAIADYIYNLEQSTAGAGVSLFKSLFPKDYYPYNAGELMSVKTSAHKTYDVDDNSLGTYPLSNIELRGIPKLVNNKIQYDGDIYKADGSVERRYGVVVIDENSPIRQRYEGDTRFYIQNNDMKRRMNYLGYVICDRLQTAINHNSANENGFVSGFASATGYIGKNWVHFSNGVATTIEDIKAWLASNPLTVVYELATPTTETTTPYTETQICDADGTEEFIDDRDVQIPVGHKTKYAQIEPINIEITNSGNVPSMPTYRIEGSGSIDVNIDGLHAVTVDMSNINAITINSEEMNAYNDTGGFANRSVTGSYENLALPVGQNTLEIDGDGVIDLLVTNYERWL